MGQDQVSMILHDEEQEIFDDGSESDESPDPTPEDPFSSFTRIGMNKIAEGTREHESVKACFLSGMNCFAKNTTVVGIHKNVAYSMAMKARTDAFKSSIAAVSEKNGSCHENLNLRKAWFCGSKEELCQIISYGFSKPNGNVHGFGVHLSPTEYLLDGLACSSCDENGVRHILYCEALMGRMEVIPRGSKQIYPSSRKFDSGVDNPQDPRILVVWSAFMNSHICPLYIVSFKAPSFNGSIRNQIGAGIGTRLCFAALLPILVKALGPAKGALIIKITNDCRERKITREEMIHGVRRVIGDDRLFAAIVRSNCDKIVLR